MHHNHQKFKYFTYEILSTFSNQTLQIRQPGFDKNGSYCWYWANNSIYTGLQVMISYIISHTDDVKLCKTKLAGKTIP